MQSDFLFLLAADVLLLSHVLFVAFVVLGLALILVGKPLGWAWILNPWFRLAHLAAIGIVVLQSWTGVICPLTSWEMALREGARVPQCTRVTISHWLRTLCPTRLPRGYSLFVTRLLRPRLSPAGSRFHHDGLAIPPTHDGAQLRECA